MAEYKIIFYPEFILNERYPVELVETSAQVNQMAARGWSVVNIVPGTNAQTYAGLFVTYVKQ